MEWEKISANLMSDKNVISRIDKELLQPNHKIKQQLDLKMGKGLE